MACSPWGRLPPRGRARAAVSFPGEGLWSWQHRKLCPLRRPWGPHLPRGQRRVGQGLAPSVAAGASLRGVPPSTGAQRPHQWPSSPSLWGLSVQIVHGDLSTGRSRAVLGRLTRVWLWLTLVPARPADPGWASISRGVLVCDECCSVHRSLGRHISIVKHLRHSAWPPTLLQVPGVLPVFPAGHAERPHTCPAPTHTAALGPPPVAEPSPAPCHLGTERRPPGLEPHKPGCSPQLCHF